MCSSNQYNQYGKILALSNFAIAPNASILDHNNNSSNPSPHPRMTLSPNNLGDIRDTSMSPRTSGTSYASRRRPPMMANAPLTQTSSRIGSYLLMSSRN